MCQAAQTKYEDRTGFQVLILALDISSVSSGWSLMLDGQLRMDAYGIIAPPKKESLGHKLLWFESAVKELINTYHPDQIIVEDIFCFNKVAFKCLAEYRGVAFKAVYELTGQDPHSMMAVEARKLVGVGCKKEQAWAGAMELFGLGKGWDYERDNDVVDSFVLCLALHSRLTNTTPPPIKATTKTPKPLRKTKKRRRKTKRKA